MNVEISSKQELVKFLSGYRNAYYEWLVLDSYTYVRSVEFSDETRTTAHADTSSIYNRDMKRKQELEEYMREIEDAIEKLRKYNQDSYRIMYFKFIRLKSLEDIACMLHYSLSHVKQTLYPKAKEDLFNLIRS